MASLRPAVVLISIAAIVWPQGALAWRLASHSLSAQAAAAMLPPGMPGFFRTAHAELAYICNDPDRWRTRSRGRAPALVAMDFPNHWFQLERHPALLPPTRQEFIMRLAASGQLIPGKQTIRDFGTAPYAIVEYAELLTETFREWRRGTPGPSGPTRQMRRVEQSAIWVGGLLCHYVTDLSQPLHTSVHIFGWSTTVPNPGDFRPQNIHGAFEGFADRCVRDRRITKSQVAKQIGEPRQVDDWLAHVASAIQESNQHVERVFELEQQGLFKSCAEDSDAVTFTVARMAVGAALLRDLWFAAWNRSR